MTALLRSYLQDSWLTASDDGIPIVEPATGKEVARWSETPVDVAGAYQYARATGGPGVRALTFTQRADVLKQLVAYLSERKEDRYYPLSLATGATRFDGKFDIDGGIGVLAAYASRGKRELPDSTIYVDGAVEKLSKDDTFSAQHVYTSRRGLALLIDAFNFPVWGMLEKFATAFLAGLPVVVRPSHLTAYLTEAVFADMVESGLLPTGAISLICGPPDGLLDNLQAQDIVAFTGSASTAATIRQHPAFTERSVPLLVEADSLNAAILGPEVRPGEPEFDLFLREVYRELTVKAGQKCTAIRRAFVPETQVDAVVTALAERLADVPVGDPRHEGVKMGTLVSAAEAASFYENVAVLAKETEVVVGNVHGASGARGDAIAEPIVLKAADPNVAVVHEVEPFGPAVTVLPYTAVDQVIDLAARGGGSLAASVYSHDPDFVRSVVLGIAPYHGRLVVMDRDNAASSTGHGSPLPGLIHGGPGRAGGSEEMGGIRGVLRYMHRTAIQASPRVLTDVTGQWVSGAPTFDDGVHPFRKRLGELRIGQQLVSESYTITSEDIERFVDLTGDSFYAHTDPEAAAASPIFGGIVAHGYLIVSRAAGLFVDPAPGPVLANYGVDNLRFLTPVKVGDSITVQLTCKDKKPRPKEGYGEVRWDAVVRNQDGRVVASYDVLTLVAI